MLFERFKEYLYLPAVFVDSRYGSGSEGEMVGKQNDGFLFFFVPYLCSPEDV